MFGDTRTTSSSQHAKKAAAYGSGEQNKSTLDEPTEAAEKAIEAKEPK